MVPKNWLRGHVACALAAVLGGCVAQTPPPQPAPVSVEADPKPAGATIQMQPADRKYCDKARKLLELAPLSSADKDKIKQEMSARGC